MPAEIPFHHYDEYDPHALGMMGNPGMIWPMYQDGASYACTEDGMKHDVYGSQWGDESEWGMKELAEG